MHPENFVSNGISAELHRSWHIPRPTLAQSSKSSQESTSSNNSTQSIKSGYLLLNAVNLARVHVQEQKKTCNRNDNLQYYLQQVGNNRILSVPSGQRKNPDCDNVSIASSTHFTVVNVNAKPQMRSRGFCRKHQLSILVISMSILFTLGVLAAIFCLEMRAQKEKS